MTLYKRMLAIAVLLIAMCSGNSFAQLNTYSFSQSTGTYQPLTTSNIFAAGTTVYKVPLPFVFSMDTVSSDTLWVHLNGYASLKRAPIISNNTTPLSTLNGCNGVMALFAAATQLSYATSGSAPGALRCTTSGTAPSRIFKVEWGNATCSGLVLSFQLWLYEGSNRIDFVYNAPTVYSSPLNTTNYAQVGLRCADTSMAAGHVINRTTVRKSYPNTGMVLRWNATDPGTSKDDRCEATTTLPTYLMPAGLTFTWTPGTSCNIVANSGTLPDSMDVCYASKQILTPTGTPSGLTYQWEYSTNNGSSWTDLISGPGNGRYFACETLPVTVTTLYRRKNTCTQTGAVSYTNTCKLKIPAPLPVPYREGFETAPGGYVLPNCMVNTDLGSLFAAGAFGINYTGTKSGRFASNGRTWLISPGLQLEAGKQYRMTVAYTSWNNDSLYLGVGNFPDETGIVSAAFSKTYTTQTSFQYRRASMVFTVPSNGRYFAGINFHAIGSADSYVDDIEVMEVPLQDGSVDSIIAPVTPTCFPTAADVTIRVRNAGQQAITNLPVYYAINGTSFGPELIPTLAPGASLAYTFNQKANLSGSLDVYNIKAWSALTGDGSAYNDSAFYYSITTDSLFAIPYTQTFNDYFVNYPNYRWYLGGVMTPHGFASAGSRNNPTTVLYSYISNVAANTTDSFATPPFGTIHGNTFLMFDYRVVNNTGYSAAQFNAGDTLFVIAQAGCSGTPDTLMRIHRNNQFSGTTLQTTDPVWLGAHAGNYVRISFVLKRGSAAYNNVTIFDIDNFKLLDINQRDLGVYYFDQPATIACQGSPFPVKVAIKNYGGLSASNFPVKVDIGNTNVLTYNYTGTLGYNKVDTINIGSFTPNITGPQVLNIYTALGNDTANGNDTIKTNIFIAVPPTAPVLTNRSICFGDTVQLSGVQNDSTLTLYYNGAASTTPIDLKTPVTVTPGNSTTYYASSRFVLPARSGKPDYTGSLFGFLANNWGINFDVVNDMILDSVAMYPTGTGTVSFSIRSCANCTNQVILGSWTATFTAANGIKVMVPVGIMLPKGKGYIMQLDNYSSGITDIKRDYPFSGYPVSRPYAPLIVVNAAGNSPSQFDGYYYFYDLVTRAIGCESNRSSINIAVNNNPATGFTVNQTNPTVALVNNSTGGGTYSWDFGDGGTSTQTSPTHTYAANGTYPIKLVQTNSCGRDSIIQSVVITGVGVRDFSSGMSSLSLYPNPATDHMTLSFEATTSYSMQLSLYNVTGVQLWNEQLTVGKGSHSILRNTSDLPPGHYSLVLQKGTDRVTLPLVIIR